MPTGFLLENKPTSPTTPIGRGLIERLRCELIRFVLIWDMCFYCFLIQTHCTDAVARTCLALLEEIPFISGIATALQGDPSLPESMRGSARITKGLFSGNK